MLIGLGSAICSDIAFPASSSSFASVVSLLLTLIPVLVGVREASPGCALPPDLQVDRQAEDRCHRLGQTRPVWVHRMVLKGTVDNNIYQIAQRKLRLDKEVLEVSGVSLVTLCWSARSAGGHHCATGACRPCATRLALCQLVTFTLSVKCSALAAPAQRSSGRVRSMCIV